MTLSRSPGSRFDGALGASALDMRLMLGTLLAAGGAGLAARPGVFPGAPGALVTGYTGPSGWAYQVAAAAFATSRGAADGAHILTNDGPALVPTDAAPGTSGANRIDIVYVLQPSKGENSDNSSTPAFAVAKGQPTTGTPVPPALPPGALELARNTMTNAATSTASAGNAIQQTWRYTALRGTPILVRNQAEADELAAVATAANPITVERLDTGTVERTTGTTWVTIAGASGLTQLRPTSVGGSGVSLTGRQVNLAGASGVINVNGVFSSQFDSYLVLADIATSSTAADVAMYLRANGADEGSAVYTRAYMQLASATPMHFYENNSGAGIIIARVNGVGGGSARIDLMAPALPQYTKVSANGSDSAYMRQHWGTVKTTVPYDGFTLYAGQGVSLTGKVRVYGYGGL